MTKETKYQVMCFKDNVEYKGSISRVFVKENSLGCRNCGQLFKYTNRQIIDMKRASRGGSRPSSYGPLTESHIFYDPYR